MLGRGVKKDGMVEEADKGEGEREVCTCPGRQSQPEEVHLIGSAIRQTMTGSGETHGLGDLSKRQIVAHRCLLE